MPRQNRKFSRRPPLKVSRERALIVCEGEKTEPNYIRDFVHHLGLTSADVRVCGEECGSDPRSIYRYAMKVFEADRDYDHVFCVFDQDGHANFVETCARIAGTRLANKKKIYCINSNPCFEYWILLHYLFTTAPIIAVGGKSAGERAVSELIPTPTAQYR